MFGACLGFLSLGFATPPPSPSPTPTQKDADGGAPSATVARGGLRPVTVDGLLGIFRPLVGIHEQPRGSNRGPLIDQFNRSAGTDLGAPWCAVVAHWGYAQLGAPDRPGAYSPSWFRKSRRVKLSEIRPGDVGLVYFNSMGRYAHTIACVEKVVTSAGRVVQVQTLEGNTNAQNSREGDQFARRVRAADTLTFMRWWPK